MGTVRLVVDAAGQDKPSEADIERLLDLLADPGNRLWLDISDPGPAEVEMCGGSSVSTSWRWRR